MVDDNGIETTLLKRWGPKIITGLFLLVISLGGFVWNDYTAAVEKQTESINDLGDKIDELKEEVRAGTMTDSLTIRDLRQLRKDFDKHEGNH